MMMMMMMMMMSVIRWWRWDHNMHAHTPRLVGCTQVIMESEKLIESTGSSESDDSDDGSYKNSSDFI
jgi:hypothetical protein